MNSGQKQDENVEQRAQVNCVATMVYKRFHYRTCRDKLTIEIPRLKGASLEFPAHVLRIQIVALSSLMYDMAGRRNASPCFGSHEN